LCYNDFINNRNVENSIDDLLITFFEKGGQVNNYYLQKQRRGPSLVYLNGWHSGKNIREALSKAIADQ
jgi:hypothetical protein